MCAFNIQFPKPRLMSNEPFIEKMATATSCDFRDRFQGNDTLNGKVIVLLLRFPTRFE